MLYFLKIDIIIKIAIVIIYILLIIVILWIFLIFIIIYLNLILIIFILKLRVICTKGIYNSIWHWEFPVKITITCVIYLLGVEWIITIGVYLWCLLDRLRILVHTSLVLKLKFIFSLKGFGLSEVSSHWLVMGWVYLVHKISFTLIYIKLYLRLAFIVVDILYDLLLLIHIHIWILFLNLWNFRKKSD